MNRYLEPDFDQRIADWLEEDPNLAPREVLGTVLAAYPSIPQRRAWRTPWRLPTINPFTRLAGAAIVAVLAAGVIFLATRPASNVGPPASPSPSASALELPAGRPLSPTAVIDLAGMTSDAIPLTTDGTDIWVGVDGAVIHVDGQTNATNRIDAPDVATGNGGIAITPDGLWIADYRGGHIKRLDPSTGTIELTANVATPSSFYVVDRELWLGLGAGLVRVDQATAAVGPLISDTGIAAFGAGDIWVGVWDGIEGEHLGSTVILRVDPATGVSSDTITVPAGAGCAVSGSFPDNVWASCPADFGTCPANRIAVRIDPATNQVVTTAKICGNPVAVINGTPWFLAGRKDGQQNAYSLVSADPATGRLLGQLDLGKIDPDVVVLTNTAVWMSDEQGDRVVRYDLSELR